MKAQQAPRTGWLVAVLLVLTALIVLLESFTCAAIILPPLADSIAERLGTDTVRLWLFLLPLPLGLLDFTAGIIALRRRDSIRKRGIILGVIVGALGVLTGLFWALLLGGVLGQVY